MERKDMIKRIEAGESPVDVCLEKYREVQCKIINDEPVGIENIGALTCALCFVFDEQTCCDKCPLKLANHPCKGGNTSWGKLYDLVTAQEMYNEEVSKEDLLEAVDAMISDLKDAKLYEKNTKTPKETEEDIYIEGERNCGLAVGDTVKVTRTAESHEKGWGNGWVEDKMFAGKIGKIISIRSEEGDNASGIEVEIDGDWWAYPYFVLEKVEQTYHVGQHFLYDNEDEYLLARIERNKVNLFNLSSGGKWSNTIAVLDDDKITEEEMKNLANRLHQWKNFTLVEE